MRLDLPAKNSVYLLSKTTWMLILSGLLAAPILGQSIPPEEHTLIAPVALVEGFTGAQITIANRTDRDIPASLTLWSGEGDRLDTLPISTKAHQLLTTDIQSALEGLPLGRVRSVSVSYYGIFRSLAAQILLSGYKGGASVDATLYEDREFYSHALNGVWWQPKGSHSHIAITNTSDNSWSVTMNTGEQTRSFLIPAHASLTHTFSTHDLEDEVTGVNLTSDAPNGVIRATGFTEVGRTYVNTLRFIDPGTQLSNSLYSTGLDLKNAFYQLSLKNLTDKPVSISGFVYLSSPSDAKSALVRPIQSVKLTPSSTGTIRLENQQGDSIDNVIAVKLSSDGGRASFVASLSVVYPDTPELSASTPFRDVTTEESATGGYPWRIDEDYETKVYLTNTTAEIKKASIQIYTTDKFTYTPGQRLLRPGETAVFDLRAIRDGRIKDAFGRQMPLTSNSGQFIWSIEAQSTDDHGVLGRTVMSSKSSKTLRSYSCYSCTCGSAITYITLGFPSSQLTVNSLQNVTTYGYYQSPCAATTVPPRASVAPAWSVSNQSVLSITSGSPSPMTGKAAGSSGLTASYSGGTITFNEGSCVYTNQYDTANATVSVVCPPAPTGESVQDVRQAETGSVTPTATDFLQTLKASVGTSIYNGMSIQESENGTGTDTCYVSGSPYLPMTSVTGSTWTVGGVTANFAESQVVTPSSGQWGPDEVGISPGAVRWYQQNLLKYGRSSVNCGFPLEQQLTLMCPGGTVTVFDANVAITSMMDATGLTNCREGVCSVHIAYQ